MKSNIILYFTLVVFNIVFPTIYAFAQLKDPIPPEIEYEEIPDDPYICVSRSAYRTSPAYEFHNQMISTYQVNVNGEGLNMIGDAANEPSIAIDPTNPLYMVIGWRQFETIVSNFRQAGYAFTFDGGIHWVFPGVIEPGVFRSDPCIDYDDEGRFYFNSLGVNLNPDYRCDVFKTVDEVKWDYGHFAFGGDKQWMTIDRTGGVSNGNIYSIWQGSSSCDGTFTYSFDRGEVFERCASLPEDMHFGSVAIGPEGEIYACGATWARFIVSKATNAQTEGIHIVWDFAKDVDLGGRLASHSGPNPGGLLGMVWIAVDVSEGPQHGNVYLLSTVENEESTKIMFSRSVDGASNWSVPVRINDIHDINSHYSWFGSMSVAPNGRIDVAWLDTGEYNHSDKSSLYYSFSNDGGLSWSPNIILSEPFNPHLGYPNQSKIGDYYHMRSDNEGAHLAWSATFNGEQDVYYSRILIEMLSNTNHQSISAHAYVTLTQNSPNPFSDDTELTYTLKDAGKVKLEIYNLFGKMVKKLVDTDQFSGEYSISWDGSDENGAVATNGVYIYILTFDDQVVLYKRMLLID